MSNTAKTFWQILSGKKTNIAAGLLLASAFLSQLVVGKWEVEAQWVTMVIDTCDWFGMALGGTGLFHKATKAAKGKRDGKNTTS